VATNLRVMIVEDEPLAVRRLAGLLKGNAAVEIVALAENARTALELIQAARPNLLLLDIEMPGMNGFELLEHLPADIAPAIIFVTAFDSYACKAFGLAVDFVLKPVAPERLAAALARARRDLETREVERKLADLQRIVAELGKARSAGTSPFAQELWVQQRSERIRIPAPEIDWIEAEKDYVRIHSGSRSFMLLGLLATLERRLDPGEFIRIHRSTIVRFDRIRSVQRVRYGALDVALEGGKRLRVGRKYAAGLRTRVMGDSPS
jgi:two-component system, LytTR family, response regulator